MFKQKICFDVWGGDAGKYQLKDGKGNPIDLTPEDTCARVSRALADIEPKDKDYWFEQFNSVMGTSFAGGGRIMANTGAGKFKKETSPINCTTMMQIPDSMAGIMDVLKDAALTLKAGCGTGYDFSTIRPKDAYVYGAGAATSGVISFMKIFDASCATVMSGGGRRGAQMGCLDISHPEIEDFITAKRQDGVLRYFNLSCLISDRFMKAIENDQKWDLWFWEKVREEGFVPDTEVKLINRNDIPYHYPDYKYFSFAEDHNEVKYGNCSSETVFYKKVYKTMNAKDLYDLIMKSTYNFAEPGFIMIDRMNVENTLYFCETIRCTNPCSEQPLDPQSSCLLGSALLTNYTSDEFTNLASFDWQRLYSDTLIVSRALDNVVEINNLPLPELREQIIMKRRHGLGFTGLGSVLNMLRIPYGSKEAIDFSEKVMLTLAQASLEANIALAKEKGCAPVFATEQARKDVLKSQYLSRLLSTFSNREQMEKDIMEYGLRYSHATSVAPTGTMSLTWGNNCSNGIEPVFANSYVRNIRVKGKKTKVQEEVMDYSYFLWKHRFGDAPLPDYWRTTDNLSVNDHVAIQAVVQKWCDSAISKTINIPTDYPFDDFKKVYMDGWKLGLKGVTTFRFNPEAFSGVLVQKSDLEGTQYVFTLEDGTEVVVNGTEVIEYDGEEHIASNLFDALKENLYGQM